VRRRVVSHTLEEERSVETNPLGGVGFLHGRTVGGGVDSVVWGLDDLGGRHILVCNAMGLWGRIGRGWPDPNTI